MHVFPVRFASDDFSFSVLMAQFTEGHSIESFLENIYNGYGSERLEASALILRPNVNDQFSTAELLEAAQGTVKEESQFLRAYGEASGYKAQAFARFDTLPIYVLHGHDLEIKISGNINPLATAPSEVSRALENTYALNEIRETEFRYLVNVSMALLPPLENSYYKNPSQRAARSWLRAGNIQFSRLSIDAATFWLLPHLRGCEAILVDTWSLSSIALNASRVLAQLRGQSPIPVEMLSQYQDYSEAKQAALLEILDRLCSEGMAGRGHTEDLNVTCIVSVTDTGSLVDVISKQADLSSLPLMLTFVAVFQIGRNDFLPSLCDLSGDKEFEPLAHGDSTDGSFIPIDERIYFPVTYVDIQHMAVQREADHFRPFVDMVMGRNVISVHRDQPSDGQTRHHAIHLDTKNLFELQEFKDRFKDKLGELCPPPSLIVTPPHPVAEEMGAFAADFFEETCSFRPKLVSHTSLLLNAEGILAETNRDVRDALLAVPEDSAILLLDDCFVTGARITGYQTRLRHLDLSPRLHYMVGVARPDNIATWELFSRRLTFRAREDRKHFDKNTITAIFTVAFPNWQEDRCPWCEEAQRYQKLVYDGKPVPNFLDPRIKLLGDRDSGLRNDLFLDPGAHEIKLYSGSLFAALGANQAEVFAAIAAAIQRLRVVPVADKPVLGPRRYPIVTVLAFNDYLQVTYTDTVIRASFLRGASREELVYSNVESERLRAKAMKGLMDSGEADKSNVTLEFILAGAMQKWSLDTEGVDLTAVANATEFHSFVTKA